MRPGDKPRAIDYPVALDNDYAIWNAFDNHYWPALYFADREGIIRDTSSARALRGVRAADPAPPARRRPRGGSRRSRLTGERGRREAGRLGGPALARDLPQRAGAGAGTGRPRAEPVGVGRRLADRRPGERPGRGGRRDRLPLPRPRRQPRPRPGRRDAPVPMRVTIDGRPPGKSHGLDVDAAGEGEVRGQRLYQLVAGPAAATTPPSR